MINHWYSKCNKTTSPRMGLSGTVSPQYSQFKRMIVIFTSNKKKRFVGPVETIRQHGGFSIQVKRLQLHTFV